MKTFLTTLLVLTSQLALLGGEWFDWKDARLPLESIQAEIVKGWTIEEGSRMSMNRGVSGRYSFSPPAGTSLDKAALLMKFDAIFTFGGSPWQSITPEEAAKNSLFFSGDKATARSFVWRTVTIGNSHSIDSSIYITMGFSDKDEILLNIEALHYGDLRYRLDHLTRGGQESIEAEEHIEWLTKILSNLDRIKPGMTRAEIEKEFVKGVATGTASIDRLSHPTCPMLNIDVEYDGDKALRVGKPYFSRDSKAE